MHCVYTSIIYVEYMTTGDALWCVRVCARARVCVCVLSVRVCMHVYIRTCACAAPRCIHSVPTVSAVPRISFTAFAVAVSLE